MDIVADVGTEMNPNGLGAYQFDLVYDLNYLEVISVSDAEELGKTGRTVKELGPTDVTAGQTVFAVYSYPPEGVSELAGPKNTVVLATATLKAKQAGVTTLNLENALLTDTKANVWPGAGRDLTTEDGTITILTNLALGRPATQSSTYDSGVASRAVDGNTYGAWGNNSVTHTDYNAQAWWQVELGAVQDISGIAVWNRTDCCGGRLSGFYVLVSDVAFTSTDLTATLGQGGVSSYYTAGQAGSPTTIAVNRTGRYVRVQLTGSNWLSLAEVEVWGR